MTIYVSCLLTLAAGESGVAATALPPQSKMLLAEADDLGYAMTVGMIMPQSACCAGSQPDWQKGRSANPVHLLGLAQLVIESVDNHAKKPMNLRKSR